MHRTKTILILLLSLFIVNQLYSQTGKAKQAIKKQERVERSLRNDYKKSRKAELKHRYNIQSPEVQERMKNSRKKTEQHYRQKNKTSISDIFERKKRKK